MHEQASPLAGQKIRIKKGIEHPQVDGFGGAELTVEDWWDRLAGDSWRKMTANPACSIYAIRVKEAKKKIPADDEVVYAKLTTSTGSYGHLVHLSEIEGQPDAPVVEEIKVKMDDLPDRGRIHNPRRFVEWVRALYLMTRDMDEKPIPVRAYSSMQSIRLGVDDLTNLMINGGLKLDMEELRRLELMLGVAYSVRDKIDDMYGLWEIMYWDVSKFVLKMLTIVQALDEGKDQEDFTDEHLQRELLDVGLDLMQMVAIMQVAREHGDDYGLIDPTPGFAHTRILELRQRDEKEVGERTLELIKQALIKSAGVAAAA